MIAVTTADAITHYLDSAEAIALIDSPNTRAAIQAAYDAGDWAPYTPPPLHSAPPEPDWPAFRMALLQSTTFRDWSEELPDTWREDLKLAAIAGNAEALQSIYDYCKTLVFPVLTTVSGWQQSANKSHIPIKF